MEKCLAPDSELGGVGCDNMTVVIVALLNGKTQEEWAAWVKKRVDEEVHSFASLPLPDFASSQSSYADFCTPSPLRLIAPGRLFHPSIRP